MVMPLFNVVLTVQADFQQCAVAMYDLREM